MTLEEFRQLIYQHTDDQLLGPCLYQDSTPYVFSPKPTAWTAFRNELATVLTISPADIRVVGSGRFGYSMKPWKNLAKFRDSSDIDVAIVNNVLFDELWLSLLRAAYPRPPFTERLGGWLKDRRHEVYTGWITPLQIHLDMSIFGRRARAVLDFKTRWFNALQKVSQYPPRRHEGLTGRLYRTWQHAELYHLNGFAVLRKSLTET
jgi:hypothetical protein